MIFGNRRKISEVLEASRNVGCWYNGILGSPYQACTETGSAPKENSTYTVGRVDVEIGTAANRSCLIVQCKHRIDHLIHSLLVGTSIRRQCKHIRNLYRVEGGIAELFTDAVVALGQWFCDAYNI